MPSFPSLFASSGLETSRCSIQCLCPGCPYVTSTSTAFFTAASLIAYSAYYSPFLIALSTTGFNSSSGQSILYVVLSE